MIEAHPARGAGFAARLAAKAERLGQAHAEARAHRRRGDPRRWRLPGLLWPLFAKER
jgi:hypothetical protein